MSNETADEPKAEEAVVAPEAEVATQGMVLYTDGSARPNPGNCGWGLHGYLYLKEVPKKASGHPDHVLTAAGYYSKAESSLRLGLQGQQDRRRYDRNIEVTPLHYVDGYGSFAGFTTNNVAELEATIQGFHHALQYDIKSLQIWTDSEHVRNGLASWAYTWRNNGWMKADQTAPANVEYWKKLLDLHEQLLARGVDVKVSWVKGHAEILGNVMADKMAAIGMRASRMAVLTNYVATTVPERYWSYTPQRHPFIAARRMYFNTMPEYIRPGEYYLGEHGKDDETFGKRVADGAFAVVALKEADPVLEMLRQHQASMAGGIDCIVMARLDAVYRPEIYRSLSLYGPYVLEQNNMARQDLFYEGKEPITRVFDPAKLAMRAVESVSFLAEKLDEYLHQDKILTVTDLTPILYETTVKTSKKGESTTHVKLKAEYNVGFSALQVDANYSSEEGVKSAPVTLTLGIDMLDRNALKRLEDLAPKVSLITWLESPNVFRYATIIEAGEDKGIWAGVYSNLRIVSEQNSKAS